jgi:hypothetical protein
MITFALAIPHAPHKPGRTESLRRLGSMLGLELSFSGGSGHGIAQRSGIDFMYRVFAEREPHWEWSKRLWRWGLETKADYLVQLQDDVLVPENFFPALRALLTTHPSGVTALMGIHPLARELARMGGRMHRTRAWLLGNGYVLSKHFLAEFCPWVERNEARARICSEDSLINAFCVETARDIFHPIPSLVDHDLSVPSTWGADNNGHRSATVSWKNFMPAEIEHPGFWSHPGEIRLLLDSLRPHCWFCMQEEAFISSATTGMHVGPNCFARMAQEAASRMHRSQTA